MPTPTVTKNSPALAAKIDRIQYLVQEARKHRIKGDPYGNQAIRQLIRKHYPLSKVTENDYVNAILARLGDGQK